MQIYLKGMFICLFYSTYSTFCCSVNEFITTKKINISNMTFFLILHLNTPNFKWIPVNFHQVSSFAKFPSLTFHGKFLEIYRKCSAPLQPKFCMMGDVSKNVCVNRLVIPNWHFWFWFRMLIFNHTHPIAVILIQFYNLVVKFCVEACGCMAWMYI